MGATLKTLACRFTGHRWRQVSEETEPVREKGRFTGLTRTTTENECRRCGRIETVRTTENRKNRVVFTVTESEESRNAAV